MEQEKSVANFYELTEEERQNRYNEMRKQMEEEKKTPEPGPIISEPADENEGQPLGAAASRGEPAGSEAKEQEAGKIFEARKSSLNKFLMYFGDEYLDREIKKIEDVPEKKRTKSQSGRLKSLYVSVEEVGQSLDALEQKLNAEPGIKLIMELIKERVGDDSVVRFAHPDEKIFDYIEETIKNANKNGIPLEDEELSIFEKYLDSAGKKAKDKKDKERGKKIAEDVKSCYKAKTAPLSEVRPQPPISETIATREPVASEPSSHDIEKQELPKPGSVDSVAVAEEKRIIEEKRIKAQKEAQDKLKNSETIDGSRPEEGTVAEIKPKEAEPAPPLPETAPEPGENLMAEWIKLNNRKKEIIEELSENLAEGDRRKLEDEMKDVSWSMIRQGCKINGKNFEAAEKEVKDEIEKEWDIKIKEQFPAQTESESFKKHQEWEEFALANDGTELSSLYDELIKESELSDKQKNALLGQKTGEIQVGRMIFEKVDVAMLIKMKLDVDNARHGFFGLSSKIIIDGKEFNDLFHFNKWIAEEKRKFIEEKAKVRAEERKQAAIKQSIEQNSLDSEIKKIYESFSKFSEESKNLIEGLGGKLDTPEQRLEALWKLQQKEDEYRKLAAEIDKGSKPISELEAKRGEHKKLAAAMLELVNVISGRDIRAEAEEKFKNEEGPKREQFIGEAVYKTIAETIKPFRGQNELFPFRISKKEQLVEAKNLWKKAKKIQNELKKLSGEEKEDKEKEVSKLSSEIVKIANELAGRDFVKDAEDEYQSGEELVLGKEGEKMEIRKILTKNIAKFLSGEIEKYVKNKNRKSKKK